MRVHAHFPFSLNIRETSKLKKIPFTRGGERETTRQKLKARTRFLCSTSDTQEEGKITSRATWPYKSMQILGNCFWTVVSRISFGISFEISRISHVMKRYFHFTKWNYLFLIFSFYKKIILTKRFVICWF